MIWKFPLRITDRQMISMPAKAEILSVGVQRNVLCLWANVDPKQERVDRDIEIIGTGNPVESAGRRDHGAVRLAYI